MEGTLKILVVVALVAVAVALFTGIFGMARGGAFNARYGNTLMRLRVILQGVAVLLLGALMLLTNL